MKLGAALLVGYALGCIPWGWLIHQRRSGTDIRGTGSGNIGATNVLRALGRGAAVLTLVLDAGKGSLAVILALALGCGHSGAALATVVGVLVEVPVMLSLVAFINRTRHWFPVAEQAT